jgi:hypothetical protein
MLKKKSKTEEKKCRLIFAFFIKKFFQNLTEDKDLKETVIAIKGFGAFAGVSFYKFLYVNKKSTQNEI